MPCDEQAVRIRPIAADNAALGRRIEGLAVTGCGRSVLAALEREAGLNGLAALEEIVNRLLVQKGADWTSVILSEYLDVYDDSAGTFSLVWDRRTGALVAHGAVFQSRAHPDAALVAHIRTADEFKNLGLGLLVTEEVTAAAFRQGAQRVVLATDDKLHRLAQGERAASGMYSRLGYAILGERRLVDTVDWLMIVDEPSFAAAQRRRTAGIEGARHESEAGVGAEQVALVERTRAEFTSALTDARIEPVRAGDLAHLFLLLNLVPERDFQVKLNSWGVHYGPELERQFITVLRQGIVDRDRLHDASLVLRSPRGAIVAVCAARQAEPLTRREFEVDFYCLPEFLAANRASVEELVGRTIDRIAESAGAGGAYRLTFLGVDGAKRGLVESLGFRETGGGATYYDAAGGRLELKELSRAL